MASFTNNPKLTDRFIEALQFAAQVHQHQIRKQGEIPYISHLMSVSALVLEAGGSEDEAIAALLHDVIEDVLSNPGNPTYNEEALYSPFEVVRQLSGYDVAYMVGNLSADTNDEYVQKIRLSDNAVQLISAADKLHNLRGYSTSGRSLWNDARAEFYGQLMPIYEKCDRVPREWIEEMKMLLASLAEGVVSLPRSEFLALQEWASQGMEWEREFQ